MTIYYTAMRIEVDRETGLIDDIDVFCQECVKYSSIPKDLFDLLCNALMKDQDFLRLIERTEA